MKVQQVAPGRQEQVKGEEEVVLPQEEPGRLEEGVEEEAGIF